MIRETALEQLSEEVPHSVAVQIDEFRESQTPIYIRAIIYVERPSQKAILLGRKGAQIRAASDGPLGSRWSDCSAGRSISISGSRSWQIGGVTPRH